MKLDNDFSDLLHESRSERFFDKIKPLINVTVIVAVLIGLIYGGVLLFGGGTKPKEDSVTTASSIANEDNKRLSDCLVGVNGDHPIPGSSDAGFYPKLIAGYDAQIACYDKYPGADNVVSRSSVEYARKTAIDSSGDYKNTYAAANGSSSSNRTNTTTGCDYSLSESEYLTCSDKYYAAHSSSGSTSSSNTGGASTPSYTPPSSSNPSTPSSTGGSSSGSTGSSSTSTADRTYWQSKCEQQVQQQTGGTSLNASQRATMVSQCMSSHGY